MTKTIKKILITGSAAIIIGIGGIAVAGMAMGNGSHMGGGYGGYHMNGGNSGHKGYGNGYGGHMMRQGDHRYSAGRYGMDNGHMIGGHRFGNGAHNNSRGMTRDMYRYHDQAYGDSGNRNIQQNNNTK